MVTRYDPLVTRLREAAQPEREAPPGFASYLDEVRRHAYRTTDEDVEGLKEAGYSEDEIFEHTVSAAVAAGLERLDAGLGTLQCEARLPREGHRRRGRAPVRRSCSELGRGRAVLFRFPAGPDR